MIESWFLNYGSCVVELNRMLGFRFIWTEDGYKSIGTETLVGESIRMVTVFHNKGDINLRDAELAKLIMLVKHLKTIEGHDKILLKQFKRKLHDTAKDWGTYFGVRMEINISASLIQKGVQFKKSESPDFIIGDSIFLETTSVHRPGKSKLNIIEKLQDVVVGKSKKIYCNSDTALCVDITNLAATRVEKDDELIYSKDDLKRAVTNILLDCNSKFGSVMLFSYLWGALDTFRSIYWRVDNKNASPELVAFLDKCYPVGDQSCNDGWVPKSG